MSNGRIYPREVMERELARLERRLRGQPEPERPAPREWPDVYQGREIFVIDPPPGFKLERELEGDGPWSWRSPGHPGVFGRVRDGR